MISVHALKSSFLTTIEIGDPSVYPCLTPLVMLTRSFSICIRRPRPYPFCLLSKDALISSRCNGILAGIPSMIVVICLPWDSPAVKNLKLSLFSFFDRKMYLIHKNCIYLDEKFVLYYQQIKHLVPLKHEKIFYKSHLLLHL